MELQTIWSWQPALYLFLGGMGAGAFVMAAVLLPIGRLAVRHTPPKSATIFSISLAVRAADRAGYPAMA